MKRTQRTTRRRDPRTTGPNRPDRAQRTEDRRSVVATVGWMLATLATLFGTILVTLLYLFAPAERDSLFPLLANYLLLACCITGALSVTVTPLVYLVRPDRPPSLIVAAVLVIGTAPWVILALQFGL